MRNISTAALKRRVGQDAVMKPLQVVLERVTRLADLGPDWDSYGGVVPSSAAIDTARQLLITLADRLQDVPGVNIQPFHVAPLADGGVQLEWRGPQSELEVEVGPNGSLGYLLIQAGATGRAFEEQDEVTWEDVLDLVSKVLIR